MHPKYYTIGYSPYNLIKINWHHDILESGEVIESIEAIRFNIKPLELYPQCEFLARRIWRDGEIYNSKEEAQEVIDKIIKDRDSIRFLNEDIIDSIVERDDGVDPYVPENLKIFVMPVLPLEEE